MSEPDVDQDAGARQLPPAFAELERYIEWAIPTERERYEKWLSSSMSELKEFYDAVVMRADDARKYLDDFEYPDLPPDALRLLWMMFSLIVVSYAVDVFGQPRVPDSGSALCRAHRRTDHVPSLRSAHAQTHKVRGLQGQVPELSPREDRGQTSCFVRCTPMAESSSSTGGHDELNDVFSRHLG